MQGQIARLISAGLSSRKATDHTGLKILAGHIAVLLSAMTLYRAAAHSLSSASACLVRLSAAQISKSSSSAFDTILTSLHSHLSKEATAGIEP